MNTDDVIEEVKKYINVFDKVKIHQFGFALIYLPFYLAIKKVCLNKPIVFAKSTGDDVTTVANLQNESYLSPNSMSPLDSSERVLRIGLSELVPTSDSDMDNLKNDTHHEPIITRMPLWGVSMETNPKVKKKISERSNVAHKVFGSKLSRLRIEDLKDDRALLPKDNVRVGTYSTRSTSYRLIRHLIGPKVKAYPGGDTEAFQALMNYQDRVTGIDIFLSIQPWLLMQYTEDAHKGARIMLVYNHPSPYKVYASLYASKLIGHEDKLLGKFMEYLAFLVWDETERLYAATPEAFDDLIKIYCNLRTKNQKKIDDCAITKKQVLNNLTNNGICSWCADPKRSALELICDSRIWHIHPKNEEFLMEQTHAPLSADVFRWEEEVFLSANETVTNDNRIKILEKYFPYTWANNINDICNNQKEQEKRLNIDPIMIISKLMTTNKIIYEASHGFSEIIFKDNLPVLIEGEKYEACYRLGKIWGYCHERMLLNGKLNDIYTNIQIGDSNDLDLTVVYLKKHIFQDIAPNVKSWARMFFDKEKLREAFAHLINDCKENNEDGSSRELRIECEYKPASIDNLLLIVISYKANDYDPAQSSFITENKIGNKIFKAYHCFGESSLTPYFNEKIEGSLRRTRNKISYLKSDADAEKTVYTINTGSDLHRWFFIFNVIDKKKAKSTGLQRA